VVSAQAYDVGRHFGSKPKYRVDATLAVRSPVDVIAEKDHRVTRAQFGPKLAEKLLEADTVAVDVANRDCRHHVEGTAILREATLA
jgi:hypothetical protein